MSNRFFKVRDRSGNQALDSNIAIQSDYGYSVKTGCEVGIGSGNLAEPGSNDRPQTVEVEHGAVLVDGEHHEIPEQTVAIEQSEAFPRWDILYANTSGALELERGTEEQPRPQGQRHLGVERPAPPDMEGVDGTPLAMIWVPADRDFVGADDIVPRSVVAEHQLKRALAYVMAVKTQIEQGDAEDVPEDHAMIMPAGYDIDGQLDVDGFLQVGTEKSSVAGSGGGGGTAGGVTIRTEGYTIGERNTLMFGENMVIDDRPDGVLIESVDTDAQIHIREDGFSRGYASALNFGDGLSVLDEGERKTVAVSGDVGDGGGGGGGVDRGAQLATSPNQTIPETELHDGEQIRQHVVLAPGERVTVYSWGVTDTVNGAPPSGLRVELQDPSGSYVSQANTARERSESGISAWTNESSSQQTAFLSVVNTTGNDYIAPEGVSAAFGYAVTEEE